MLKKKSILFALIMALAIPFVFALSSCGNSDKSKKTTKLPTSTYEKVAFAFNGVQSSFKKINSSAKKEGNTLSPYVLLDGAQSNGDQQALTYLSNLLNTYGEDRGDVTDDISYNEPPMVQFQCLKSIMESIGNSYSFGEKYYNDILGTVYIDENGFKVENSSDRTAENTYQYKFTLSIQIDIDETDFITAYVGFNIELCPGTTFVHSDNNYFSRWYVEMRLDYDMKSLSPDYELLMLTSEQKNTPFLEEPANVYEYDYVKVDSNKIDEWRKFVLQSDVELVKDQDHQDFGSFQLSEGDYNSDTIKWYKNNNLKKLTTDDNKDTVASYLFMLGLNVTDINGTPFTQKAGIKESVITSFYNTIKNQIGQDLVYELVCKDEDEYLQTPSSIAFYKNNGQQGFENYKVKENDTLANVLSLNTLWEDDQAPEIWYLNSERGQMYIETDLNAFDYQISLNGTDFINVTLDTTIESALAQVYGNELDPDTEFPFQLKLILESNDKVFGILSAKYDTTVHEEDYASLGLETEWNNQPIIYAYDDVKIESMFTENGSHVEFSMADNGQKDVVNPKIFYYDKMGQKKGQVPFDVLRFYLHDENDSDGIYSKDLSNYDKFTLSRLWTEGAHAQNKNTLKFRVVVENAYFFENYIDFEIVLYDNYDIPLYTAIHGQPSNPEEEEQQPHDYRLFFVFQVKRIEPYSDEAVGIALDNIRKKLQEVFNTMTDTMPMPYEEGEYRVEFLLTQTTEEAIDFDTNASVIIEYAQGQGITVVNSGCSLAV